MRTSVMASLVLVTVLGAAACQPAAPPPPPPPPTPQPAVVTLQRRDQVNRLELTTRSGQTTLQRSKYLWAAEPSPDGTRIATVLTSGASSELAVRPLKNGKLGDATATYRGSIGEVMWSPDGTRLAVAGAPGTNVYGIDIVDAANAAVVRQIPATHVVVPDTACALAGTPRLVPADWHPAGTHLLIQATIAGCSTNFIDLLEVDLATGTVIELADLGAQTTDATYSPDGNSVLASGTDGMTVMIDRRTGNRTPVALRVLPAWGPKGLAAMAERSSAGVTRIELGNPVAVPWLATTAIPAPRGARPEWSSDGTGLLVQSDLGVVLHPVGVDAQPLTVEVLVRAEVLSAAVVRGFS